LDGEVVGFAELGAEQVLALRHQLHAGPHLAREGDAEVVGEIRPALP